MPACCVYVDFGGLLQSKYITYIYALLTSVRFVKFSGGNDTWQHERLEVSSLIYVERKAGLYLFIADKQQRALRGASVQDMSHVQLLKFYSLFFLLSCN